MSIIKKLHLSTSQIIILGFLATILVGAFILMLPISSKNGVFTPFLDAFFTATSAVCVTGLVVFDTAIYWSLFGHIVILLLIQIGGLGVITLAVSFFMLSGKKIGLMQRSTMQEAIASPTVGGIVKLTGFILKTTFIIEVLGAILMLPVFLCDFGGRGIGMSVFHSVSAFCNAGFDILGTDKLPFQSLTGYMSSGIINIVIMCLIVVGGIGFLVWNDIKINKWHIRKYRMQSKVVLSITFILILLPFLYFFFFEFSQLNLKNRILASLFQSVTARTAGFNTADLTELSSIGQTIMIILMLIGGSPGSTAGGLKTTTIAVLIFSAISVFRKKADVECFGRRIDNETIKNASAILIMYVTLFTIGGLIISQLEGLRLSYCLFETASAIGTVGATLGITPQLGAISKIILIMLMFLGRVGGLTIIFATFSNNQNNTSKKPLEKITVG